MPQKNILVVGSLNMDQVARIPHVPVWGETLLAQGSLRLIPGGKGANQAVAMARLGGAVAMAGCVGNDPFGTQLLHALHDATINTDLIVVDQKEASGTAFIFLGPDGDNAIIVAPGTNARVGHDMEQLARIFASIEQASAVVMQLEIPLDTVQKVIAHAHRQNVPVILNLAPAQQLPRKTLQQLSVLVVNETEASLLSGQRLENREDAKIVATVLLEYGIPTVVITLGSRGALLATRDKPGGQIRTFYQEAPKVHVVDTTAAGDCFVGALTVALTEQQQPEQALRFATYASALKVTRFGAQSGLPTREEVIAFYS
ncbi:MAG: ribokinase [Ktedonobacteraceae bacterium]|nr:ribokinase [Ktedonobacteraceae bacterium]